MAEKLDDIKLNYESKSHEIVDLSEKLSDSMKKLESKENEIKILKDKLANLDRDGNEINEA